jgi:hypothetical protein
MRECDRLGLDDRAERLAVCAALLGVDELGSTRDLVMGQAGQLLNILQRTRDRGDLPDVTPAADGDEDQGDEQVGEDRITIPEAIIRIMVMVHMAYREKDRADTSGDVGRNIERLRTQGGFTCDRG